eukprot:338818_1
MMASSVGLIALLSSISTVDGSREEFTITTTDVLQHRHNVFDEHATNKKFILPNKLMQTQHRLARLLEKRRSLNQEVDVGVLYHRRYPQLIMHRLQKQKKFPIVHKK